MQRRTWVIAIASLSLLWSVTAEARRDGIAVPGCDGCHDTTGAQLELTVEPLGFEPGDEVSLTVVVSRASGALQAAGLYIARPAQGTLGVVSGEGLVASGGGLTHDQPKSAQGGVVTFQFLWQAPEEPGAVRFSAYGLAANDDGSSSGDVAGSTRLVVAYGCPLQEFYYDIDADGFGSDGFTTAVGCEGPPPVGYAIDALDCNEGDVAINPAAVELCNLKDDDCDGEVDENAILVELWPDEDGDGYYASQSGTPVTGCVGAVGYALLGGDCAPQDARVNPGVVELCNSIDDNCDQRTDERVRPQCGIGLCRRESTSCDVERCVPGAPTVELCNLLDDDCDEEVDEGPVCPDGQSCLVGSCLTEQEVSSAPVLPPMTSGQVVPGFTGESSSTATAAAQEPAAEAVTEATAQAVVPSLVESAAFRGPRPHDSPDTSACSIAGRAPTRGGGLVFLATCAALTRRLRRRRSA